MKKLVILLLLHCCRLSAQEVQVDSVWINGTPVQLKSSVYGNGKKAVFINLHANETTSIEAAQLYLAEKEGLLLELLHDTTRLVHFWSNGTGVQFDPNRIFTKKGRQSNLKLLNARFTTVAEKNVSALADKIISKLKSAKIIIAMHNNTDGQPLSVKSFKQKYVNPGMDPDDFILTTELKIFNRLKKRKINVVLQTQKTSPDDGSLAIYCSKKKIPYINIEAQQGHIEEQLNMLNALTDIIQQYTR
jgi:hypothetical protein